MRTHAHIHIHINIHAYARAHTFIHTHKHKHTCKLEDGYMEIIQVRDQGGMCQGQVLHGDEGGGLHKYQVLLLSLPSC